MMTRTLLTAGFAAMTMTGVSGAAPLAVTNGDFETVTGPPATPFTGNGNQNVAQWFDSTDNFSSWHFGNFGDHNVALNGWLYQSIGVYDAAEGTTLNWSFDTETTQAAAPTGEQEITFYAGAFGGAADGDDISDEGLTNLGGVSGLVDETTHTGSIDLSGLTNGTEVWVRIGGDRFEQIDNVSVTQVPEPGSLALLGLGSLLIGARRRRG